MAKRYVIWDEKSDIYTPSGAKFTAEEWMKRYPIVELETEYLVISGNAYNGGFCMVYSVMVDHYARQGCDFSACVEMQDYLDAIEAFEDEMNAPSTEKSAEERQAEALEAIASGATSETTEVMNALLGEV